MFKTTVAYFFAGALTCLLVLNIISSQLVPPFLPALAAGDRASTVTYLQSISDLPEFEYELGASKEIFGDSIEDEVHKKDETNTFSIQNLEELLTKNPKARDVLYKLHQEYMNVGDVQRSQEYLQRAQKVDPAIK